MNPTCPDIPHPRNITYQQVQRLARAIGAASCGVVNLATRRTGRVGELLSVTGDLVGPRHVRMLERGFAQADIAVVAYGRVNADDPVLGPLRDTMIDVLRREHDDGLVVAQIGEYPSHPWPWMTTVPGGDEELLRVLSAATLPARSRAAGSAVLLQMPQDHPKS